MNQQTSNHQADHQSLQHNAPNQESAEYETAKGCLMLTIAILVCSAISILAIVLSHQGTPPS
ncbi:MAG: hypothetical protein ACSHX5_11010 [Phycisphaerales bacterium]